MATWPTNPDWTDVSNINAGNEYVAADGLTAGAMNAIVKNLEYLKNTTGTLAPIATSGKLSDAIEDETHRTVTDEEKATWNAKQDKLTAGANIEINGNVISAKGSGSDASYIDLEPYATALASRETIVAQFNAAIVEAVNNKPTGAERANIYFYNSGTTQFILKDDVHFVGNCNYYFLDSNQILSTNFLVLSNIKNCDFYGLNLGSVMDGNTLTISQCSNLQFFNSIIVNGQSQGILIEESTDIYFENCTISGGSFTHNIVKVINKSNTLKWAMFDNCIFDNLSTQGYKVIEASGVTNSNQLITLSNCYFNDLADISESDIAKGAAVIKIIAINASITAAYNQAVAYVDEQIGNINTLLTNIDTGMGV